MKTYQKIVTENRLKITHDEDPESPREWSNVGFFITKERDYRSPDKNIEIAMFIDECLNDGYMSSSDMIEAIKDHSFNSVSGEKPIAVFPVSRYEHGSVVYKLGIASGFDSSNCGFYLVFPSTLKEIFLEDVPFEKVKECIINELELYTSYANGEVYQFVLYNEDGEVENSCSGIFDIDSITEHLPDEWKDENMQDYFVY